MGFDSHPVEAGDGADPFAKKFNERSGSQFAGADRSLFAHWTKHIRRQVLSRDTSEQTGHLVRAELHSRFAINDGTRYLNPICRLAVPSIS